MSTFHLITAGTSYLESAVLLSFCAGILSIARLAVQNGWLAARFQELLRFSKLMILAAVFLPVVFLTFPQSSLMKPHAQIFSSGSAKTSKNEATIQIQPAHSESEQGDNGFVLQQNKMLLFMGLIGMGSLFSSALFLRRLKRIHSVLSDSQVIKKIGGISLLASQEISSPFSYWNFAHPVVVVPNDFLPQRQDLRIALQHEFQHLRSRDTQWIFALELQKILFYWNPFVYLLVSQIHQIQEFACDEFLIGHQKASPQAYGSCLVRAAESAVHSQSILVGTASMSGSVAGSFLKRRIEMLFKTQTQTSKLTVVLINVACFTLMASFAYASKSAVQEKKLTMEEAQVYVDKTAKQTEIPIDLNDLVLAKLNYFVGTSHGRAWAKSGLRRMKSYQKMIDAKISKQGLPEMLIAIPMFESGFQNDVISPSPYHSKGIWQFIAQTAENFDLKVNDQVDERLDPAKETDAAMKYFKKLNSDFHDWRLAIKAYNEGENQVHTLIDQLGTKDPWVIEHKESKEAYLSGAIAMMIVIKNPELLN